MIIHGLLALQLGWFDQNMGASCERQAQIRKHAIVARLDRPLALGPLQLAPYLGTRLWLIGNPYPPLGAFPHAPAESEYSVGLQLRALRGPLAGWYLDANHTSWHGAIHLRFETRQWTGAEFGLRW